MVESASERLAAPWRVMLAIQSKDIAHYVQPASPRQKVRYPASISTHPRLQSLRSFAWGYGEPASPRLLTIIDEG